MGVIPNVRSIGAIAARSVCPPMIVVALFHGHLVFLTNSDLKITSQFVPNADPCPQQRDVDRSIVPTLERLVPPAQLSGVCAAF